MCTHFLIVRTSATDRFATLSIGNVWMRIPKGYA